MPEKFQKRDGRVETWSVDRIAKAIFKSLWASGIKDSMLANRLASRVERQFEDVSVPEQEDVQDMVEQVLMEERLYSVARKYILYRESRRGVRSQDQAFLEGRDTSGTFVKRGDAHNRDLSIPPSFQAFSEALAGSVRQRYALEQYPEEIRLAHDNGYLHIHDLSFGMAGYCAGWDLNTLLGRGCGFKGVTAHPPATHLDSAFCRMVAFLTAMQGEWAAAQTFSHVDTLLAPLVRWEGLDEQGVGHVVENFVLGLDSSLCANGPALPCALGFDGEMPGWLQKTPVRFSRAPHAGTYAEYVQEAAMITRALTDVLLAGDHLGQAYRSPAIFFDIGPGFQWESVQGEGIERLIRNGRCVHLRLTGTRVPTQGPSDGRLCGIPYGAGERTGSVGVVSLNLPKLAFLAGGETDFLNLIEEYAEYAKQALEFKRKILSNYMARNMYPYSGYYLEHGFGNHCSTMSVVGGHEACLNLLSRGIASPEGTVLMTKVLERLGRIVAGFTAETGNTYTLAGVLDEKPSTRLAAIDRDLYSGIAFSNSGYPHYTNGMGLPKDHGLDLETVVDHQSRLLPLFSGGAVMDLCLPPQRPQSSLAAALSRCCTLSGASWVRFH
ncbi:anaerobic ribonucleoside-triphosphate reductase [Desulfoplanes sp.]